MLNKLIKSLISLPAGPSPAATAFELVGKDVQRFRRLLGLGAVLIFFNSMMILPLPFVIGKIIDIVLPHRNIRLLLILVAFLFAVNTLGALLGYVQDLLFFRINNRIILNLRRSIFLKINHLPLTVSRQYNTGYLMSRINDDPPQLATLFGERVIQLLRQLFTFSLGLAALVWIDWQLTLLTLGILPLFLLVVYRFSHIIRQKSEKAFERTAQTSSSLQENLSMVELCKSLEKPVFNLRRYFKEAALTYRAFFALRRSEGQSNALLGFVGSLMPLSILAVGGYKIISGKFSIGMMVTFMNLLGNVVGPAASLIGFNIELQKVRVALGRIGQILDLPEEVEFAANEEPHIADVFSIKMNDVDFSYNGAKPVLQKISFRASKGEKIGIVGASGSGKTSLGRVLSGLYPFAGEILLDGRRIDATNYRLLRRHTAVVSQEPFLFRGTVQANIALANSQASASQIRQTLQQAHALEFVERMPGQEHAQLSDQGQDLSLGQKQRLTIARALLKKAPILILDEATANVDNISEKLIGETVNQIRKEKIIFLIAHRLELLEDCDQIIMLHDGKIVECGRHEELLAANGLYARQYYRNLQEKAI